MKFTTVLRKFINWFGLDIRRLPGSFVGNIPDREFYKPLFSPWLGYGAFRKYYNLVRKRTIVSQDRCYVLFILARQALKLPGDFWECGVYRGGTAKLISTIINNNSSRQKDLHLFDTFNDIPGYPCREDLPQRLDFSDTDLDQVRNFIGPEKNIFFHAGKIPDTFSGLETNQIAFAHIDVVIYKSTSDCCKFILPRLVPGGFIVFDDYGSPLCPGARAAVDEYFEDKPHMPLALPTGQAIVFNSFPSRQDFSDSGSE